MIAGAVVGSACAEPQPALARGFDGRLVPSPLEIVLGDSAATPVVTVRVSDGPLEVLKAPAIHSYDTSIVRVDSGKLVARRMGRADLQFSEGGRTFAGAVRVLERIFDGEVRLSAGEVRAWELEPGQIEITVTAAEPGTQLRSLELAAGLRCATSTRTPESIHCRVHTPTRLVLKHTAAHRAAETARVRILRGPE